MYKIESWYKGEIINSIMLVVRKDLFGGVTSEQGFEGCIGVLQIREVWEGRRP